jgi:hypothetical protein
VAATDGVTGGGGHAGRTAQRLRIRRLDRVENADAVDHHSGAVSYGVADHGVADHGVAVGTGRTPAHTAART